MRRNSEEIRPAAAPPETAAHFMSWPGLEYWTDQGDPDLVIALWRTSEAPSRELLEDRWSLEEGEPAEKRGGEGEGSFFRLLGRLAAKAAASALWGVQADEVQLRRAPSGAPELLLQGRLGPAHAVSISHTQGLVAAAAAREARVGLDVELRTRLLTPKVAAYAFTPEEKALAAGAADDANVLLALWCAKEAAAKSWGLGLLNHLRRVRVAAYDHGSGQATVIWTGPEACQTRVVIIDCRDHLLALARTPRVEAALK